MKIAARSYFFLASGVIAGAVQAQTVQQYSFPSQQTSASPPSTLRITETPLPAATPAPVIRDTPESVRMYDQCREVSDRAAVSNAEMRAGVARCLKELEARRQPQ